MNSQADADILNSASVNKKIKTKVNGMVKAVLRKNI